MFSKTDILALMQCPRALWLRRHDTGLIPAHDANLARRTLDGAVVGAKARAALGPDVLWPAGDVDKQRAAATAQAQLLAQPTRPAAEVVAVREDLHARADALIPRGDGYVLQETKASAFPLKPDGVTPARPNPWHVNDLALQAWCFEGGGLSVRRTELNLLDTHWRYPGGNDYAGLFRQLDVSDEVRAAQAEVPTWLAQARDVVAGPMPAVTTGKHCQTPHDCPFRAVYCELLDPPAVPHPIELLPDSAGKALARRLQKTCGYTSLLEPHPKELVGANAELYQRIQLAHRTGDAVVAPGADVVMAALPYPRYYFDFEGIDLPVPRWPGTRPYEQVPFQWSCHIEHRPGVFTHHAFLDVTGGDPTVPCIERMLEVIQDDGGPILVYYAAYERGRLVDMAMRQPAYGAALSGFVSRLVDLHPLVKAHYYHPRMEGSFSIKKVLPCIAPDMDYAGLDGVQDGTAAQVAYLQAAFDENFAGARGQSLRQGMLTYCAQDTWGMVEVGYFLERGSRPMGLRPEPDLTPLGAC